MGSDADEKFFGAPQQSGPAKNLYTKLETDPQLQSDLGLSERVIPPIN
jgi:hypothetical protein